MNTMRIEFSNKILDLISTKKARVTVIGGGYVGLPLAIRCAKVGYQVTVFDKDKNKINSLNAKKSYVEDISNDDIESVSSNMVAKSYFPPDSDIIIICVPTPLNKHREPDASMVLDAAYTIRDNSAFPYSEKLIILESTVYPSFTREVLKPAFGSEWGEKLFLAFSPERIDPGNIQRAIQNTPKVVGGIDSESTKLASAFYSDLASTVVPVSNSDTAEMAKIVENTFRMVNIGLANETAIECQKLDINVWEVIEAASTKPFGFMPFWPGPGVGGECIGLDPHYLAWKLHGLNYRPRFIELAEQINSSMPEYVVRRTIDALSFHGRKAILGASILVLGVSYKANVADLRESPALRVVDILLGYGARVKFFDPHVQSFKLCFDTMICERDPITAAGKSDCVLITTNHSNVDYNSICNAAPLIVDVRNATKELRKEGKFLNKIVML